MNILIPHQWLLEHLETKATPEQIQKYLSLCGPSIERIYDKEGESVYDIEITTNRVDSMSVRGVAREAAAILPQFGIGAKLTVETRLIASLHDNAKSRPLPQIINNPKLCRRLSCVILQNVHQNPTPNWMANRLKQIDANIHDASIDITNYITHELGHPCHAFDYDKLMKTGGVINIVEAKKGEQFQTLDGESFVTVGGEVVFKNKQGEIIDLPSIKGTANTSVDAHTKNILLLLESITAEKVRFASMTHAIRTTAAQLMEKNVDPHLITPTIHFGIKLYQDLCGAQVASEIYDDFPESNKPAPIKLDLTKIKNYLGVDIEVEKITAILEALECKVLVNKVKKQSVYRLIVTPPSFRPDLKIPVDVIEEIARIYGYHNLPSQIMDGPIPLQKPENSNFELENKAKHFLAAIGYQEIYSYSMVSAVLAQEAGYKLAEHLKIQNPLTDDRVYLRRSLIPSLQEVFTQNPLEKTLSVFEIASTYLPAGEAGCLHKKELPQQPLLLTLVSNKNYREFKGDFMALLDQLFIKNWDINKYVKILDNNCYALEIEWAEILKRAKTHPNYQPLPKTNSIVEDLTFTLNPQVKVGELMAAISRVSQLITRVELKDIYGQNYTFTLEYIDPNGNLSAKQLLPIRQKVVKMVEEKFRSELVGRI